VAKVVNNRFYPVSVDSKDALPVYNLLTTFEMQSDKIVHHHFFDVSTIAEDPLDLQPVVFYSPGRLQLLLLLCQRV